MENTIRELKDEMSALDTKIQILTGTIKNFNTNSEINQFQREMMKLQLLSMRSYYRILTHRYNNLVGIEM